MRLITAALYFAPSLRLVSSAALERRQTSTTTKPADSQCTNGPKSRACWTKGYSIATDFDQKFPITGNTIPYNPEITNGTCNPDGNGPRVCMLINGQYPGPTIHATWGDKLVINVKNSMQHNGTSIHWHAVRQYHSTGEDGVNGVTECALAPGDSTTYAFQVSQFGTSWYHAHFSSQYGDGVVGPMVFEGPATSNYDEDLGPYMVNDWYHQVSTSLVPSKIVFVADEMTTDSLADSMPRQPKLPKRQRASTRRHPPHQRHEQKRSRRRRLQRRNHH